MSGRRYTEEQNEWLHKNYHSFGTYGELTDAFNTAFNDHRTSAQLHDLCIKRLNLRGIRDTSTQYGNKAKEQVPIGTIRKTQNRTFIKVLEVPRGSAIKYYTAPYWIPLANKVWLDAGRTIPEGHFLCKLNGNEDDMRVENLYPITRAISVRMSQNGWWSDNPEMTLTAIKWCECDRVIRHGGCNVRIAENPTEDVW